MSHQRELRQAELAALEALDAWALKNSTPSGVSGPAYNYPLSDPVGYRLFCSWNELNRLRTQVDGDAAASARDTSIAAGKKNLPSITTLRGQVAESVWLSGKAQPTGAGGSTCDELERRLRRKHQSVSSAVNHAENHGWIVDSGRRRKTSSGSHAIVYEPSDALIEAMAERRRVG